MKRRSSTVRHRFSYLGFRYVLIPVRPALNVPVDHPFESRVSPRCSTLNIASPRCGNVSLDIEVGKERCVELGTGGTAPAEGHRVRAVQALAVGLGLNVSGVLSRVRGCYWLSDSGYIPCTSIGQCKSRHCWC